VFFSFFRRSVLSPFLSLLPFAGLVKRGSFGRVGDGFGNDELQRSNRHRLGGFSGH
jgi:hypothetical protein